MHRPVEAEVLNNEFDKSELEKAYKDALVYAKTHYENFPVVSFLVPKHLRKHVAIIYWFARTADDIADEGHIAYKERLEKLDHFESRLNELLKGNFINRFELALFSTIKERQLTARLFFNLLKAFKQDLTKKRYSTFGQLLEYCDNSANPVGRLILELSGIRDGKAFYLSDKICTALQLTNFWQDTTIDFKKDRVYYPAEDMRKFGVEEKSFELKENNLNFKELVRYNVERTFKLFEEGKGLIGYLSGKLKYEIKWTILGGEEVLRKIEKNDYNVLRARPSLSKKDFSILFLKSFF